MIEMSAEKLRSQFYKHMAQKAAAAAAAAAAVLCVAILLLLLLQEQCCCFPLLFVTVCRIAKFVAGPLNLTPVFSFSSFKRDFFLMVPVGSTVSNWRPRVSPILGSYGHARRQGGRQPAAANPPYIYINIYIIYISGYIYSQRGT